MNGYTKWIRFFNWELKSNKKKSQDFLQLFEVHTLNSLQHLGFDGSSATALKLLSET